jgi:hypothetical protein
MPASTTNRCAPGRIRPQSAPRLARLFSAAALASLPLALSGCVGVGSLHEQTASFQVESQSPTALSVSTRNGAVRVEPWAGSTIAITAHLKMTTPARLEQTTISAERTPAGLLEITAIPPDGRWASREGCSFEILVPAGGTIQNVDIRTHNARIEITGLGGEAHLNTSNGRITVNGHDGPVSAETSNGSITVTGATGAVKAHTSNGTIRAQLAAENAGPLDVRTSNGAITLHLPREFAGMLDLRTSNGAVTVSPALRAQLLRHSRSTALVSMNVEEGREGESASRIHTSNGSITVEEAGR